jgi:uncharacterized protein
MPTPRATGEPGHRVDRLAAWDPLRKARPVSPAPALLGELQAVYDEVDAAFAGWSCPASTECCRFGITGREPYVTSIELLAVERALAARGGPIRQRTAAAAPAVATPKKRALPLADPVLAERRCPLLGDDGRCGIYASRPLGCRTFYCDRATAGGRVAHREVGAMVRRIQAIAARHETDGDRGRPLTRALGRPTRAAAGGPGSPRGTGGPSRGRRG